MNSQILSIVWCVDDDHIFLLFFHSFIHSIYPSSELLYFIFKLIVILPYFVLFLSNLEPKHYNVDLNFNIFFFNLNLKFIRFLLLIILFMINKKLNHTFDFDISIYRSNKKMKIWQPIFFPMQPSSEEKNLKKLFLIFFANQNSNNKMLFNRGQIRTPIKWQKKTLKIYTKKSGETMCGMGKNFILWHKMNKFKRLMHLSFILFGPYFSILSQHELLVF